MYSREKGGKLKKIKRENSETREKSERDDEKIKNISVFIDYFRQVSRRKPARSTVEKFTFPHTNLSGAPILPESPLATGEAPQTSEISPVSIPTNPKPNPHHRRRHQRRNHHRKPPENSFPMQPQYRISLNPVTNLKSIEKLKSATHRWKIPRSDSHLCKSGEFLLRFSQSLPKIPSLYQRWQVCPLPSVTIFGDHLSFQILHWFWRSLISHVFLFLGF